MGGYRISKYHQHHRRVAGVTHEAVQLIGFQGLFFPKGDVELKAQHPQLNYSPDTKYRADEK